ncbi:MAG TPA: zf-TFIIB domain-containing protein [Acidobacteriota bacterium]
MKRCPVCLVTFTPLLPANETEIDYCKSCKSVWFDGKELERVHREEKILHAILDTTTLHPSPFRCKNCGTLNRRSAATCSTCRNELQLHCPRCDQALKGVLVGRLQADRCEQCRGVWLDGGELGELFQEFQKVKMMEHKQFATMVAIRMFLAQKQPDARSFQIIRPKHKSLKKIPKVNGSRSANPPGRH